MRNKIFGVIGVLWGGAILVSHFMKDSSGAVSSNEAYQAGQSAAVVMGGLLLIAGLYYFFKK